MMPRILMWALLVSAPLWLVAPSGLDGPSEDFCLGDCLCPCCFCVSALPPHEVLPHWQAEANDQALPVHRCLLPVNGAFDDVYRPPRAA